MFDNYIDELLKNINKTYDLDVVIEGGAFNGSYILGILFFLKRMEKKKLIKIKRFSGCSIGGILCFQYLTNNLKNSLQEYTLFRDSFYKHQNFNILEERIDLIIKKMKNFEKIKKNKLFLTFYNNKKQIVQSEYKDKEDLKNALLKTSHLPYLINGDCYLKLDNKFYLDGLFPHIFLNRKDDILYISPNNFSRLQKMFIVKNEISTYGRVSEGILDAYNFFFYNKPSQMCSFVNRWSIIQFTSTRLKHLFMYLLVRVIYFFERVLQKILPYLKTNEMYNVIEMISKNICYDICFMVIF